MCVAYFSFVSVGEKGNLPKCVDLISMQNYEGLRIG